MYLWDAFAAAARTVLPQAAIVHDKYHLERLNQRAIDLTRRQELPEIPELKGKRFWLLRSSATRPPEHQAFFDAIHQSISTTARPGRLPKTSEQSINSRLPLMLDPGDVQTSV
jgi:transposase